MEPMKQEETTVFCGEGQDGPPHKKALLQKTGHQRMEAETKRVKTELRQKVRWSQDQQEKSMAVI